MSSDGEDDRDRIDPAPEDEDDAESRAADSSEEDSSEDEDDDGNAKLKQASASVETLLKRVLQRIQDRSLDLTDKDQLAAFKSRELDDLAADTGDRSVPTALHILLQDTRSDLAAVPDEQMKALVTCLVQHENDALAKGDREGKTPLYQAIDFKKEKMLEWMCEAYHEVRNLNSILSKQISNKGKKQYYLHMALGSKVKYFKHLVQKADGKTLALPDEKGRTILHLAVAHRRCRKGQLAIIEDILARGDEEIVRAHADFDHAGESPYLYHKRTVREAEEAASKPAGGGDKGRENKADDRGRIEHSGSGSAPSKAAPTTSNPTNPGGNAPANPNAPAGNLSTPAVNPGNPRGGSGPGNPALGTQDQGRSKGAAQSNSKVKYGGAAPGAEPAGVGTESKKRVTAAEPEASNAKAKKSKSESKKQSKVDDAVVKGVERCLKLHYLRARSGADCMEILYGKDKVSDLQLYFDLSGRSSMKRAGLEALLKHLTFEDALQYVYIPSIKIEAPTEGAAARRAVRARPADLGTGRRDLVDVFDGLRRRGVGTVLKVVVDDSLDPPHTDEAIEEALRNLDVEVWDWRKPDLSTEVIYNAAPRVREVHLYWGGNNAVLRGWAEDGGLKKLSELRRVHLHHHGGLESANRTRRYVQEFCDRVRKPGVREVIVHDGSNQKQQAGVAAQGQGIKDAGAQTSKHSWIDCMKKFRGLLINAEQMNEYRKMSQTIEEPIRVALIDDGVDVTELDKDNQPIGGLTFSTRDEANNLSHPYYASSTGHGTAMAKLITFMCPRAQLYVLRLEDHPGEGAGARQISAKSAAKAITAAVKKGVHIISMSWTIDPPTDEEVRNELEKAIQDADKANILMFCSVADTGAKQTDTYPSKATQRIFTIGAAGPSGETTAWVGNQEKISFTFPGDRVELMDGAAPETTKEVTGSSVATALAAGFAALVLYCVQVKLWSARTEAEKAEIRENFEALKRHEQMSNALAKIGTTRESKYKFIMVWNVFKIPDTLRLDDPDQLVRWIARIGGLLCGGLSLAA